MVYIQLLIGVIMAEKSKRAALVLSNDLQVHR